MKQSRARIAAIIVAAAAVSISLWRSRIIKMPGQAAPLSQREQKNVDRKAILPRLEGVRYSSAQEIGDAGGVREVLAPRLLVEFSRFNEGIGGSPAQLEAVIADVSSFVKTKFLDPSPDAYLIHMYESGYVPMRLDEVVDAAMSYEEATGEPMPEGATPEQVYRAILEDPRFVSNRQYRFKGLAIEPGSVVAAQGEYCAGHETIWPEFESSLGADTWFGGRSGTASRLHRGPGLDWFDRIKAGQCIDTLAIGLLFSFEDGVKLPISFLYFFDRETRRWWLALAVPAYMPEDYGGIII